VRPEPEFPNASRRLRESGSGRVRVFIDEAGMPRSVEVTKSSGFSRLDQAFVVATKKARFKPPTLDGHPISGFAEIPFEFELEN